MRQSRRMMTIGALALAACQQVQPAEVAELEATLTAQKAALEQLQRRLEALETSLAPPQEEASPGKQPSPVKASAPDGDAGADTPGAQGSPVSASAPEEDASPKERVFVTSCENDHCVVTRAEINAIYDALFDDPAEMAKMARILPSMKDGVSRGLKVYGIRPDSWLARTGLRNGDLLRRLADVDLRDIEASMSVMSKLRELDRWTVVGERKGAPFEITVEVR